MSLFHLKTRDLSWQDHTVNTEAMLAPARSGLLLNKHKTLTAKCASALHLYERQRSQRLQDFLAARRLLDRQRQKLLKAQRQIRARSCQDPPSPSGHPSREYTPAATDRSDTPLKTRNLRRRLPGERSISAPVGVLQNTRDLTTEKLRTSLQEAKLDPQGTQSHLQGAQPCLRLSASVFLTDGDGSRTSISSVSSGRAPVVVPDDSLVPPVLRVLHVHGPGETTRAALAAGRSVGVRFTEPHHRKAAREEAGDKRDDDDDNKQRGGRSPKTLEERVQAFVADVTAFNARSPDAIWRQIRKDNDTAGKTEEEGQRKVAAAAQRLMSLDLQPPTSAGEKLARRASTWQSEGQIRVLAAFDEFCKHGTVEDLTRAMRLASRFKISGLLHRRSTNVTTTNSSNNEVLVSTMGSFRSTRGCRSLLQRQQQQQTSV